ncbi:MAG: right-handed parallel beta-helix repeat-containing protein [Rhizonema sp. NSF051]|nr:right-handed parallel beta-helix repeat-containing protein [Rhizonema sp. NSF051]
MDFSSSTTDPTAGLSVPTQVFSDNVQDLLGVSTLPKNPSAIFTVNSTADVVDDSDNVMTLREAINQANNYQGESLIVFERSLFANPQTITLNLGELNITHNLDIIAPHDQLTGMDLVTVSANKASRVFEIGTDATVTLSGLIIADGGIRVDNLQGSRVAIDNGGGIKNNGALTLDSSIVSNNSITDPSRNNPVSGGGIYNGGTLDVRNSTITGNEAGVGGGISNQGTLIVSNSTLSNNLASQRVTTLGGGIYNTGTAKVLDSTFDDNRIITNAGASGSGIYNAGNFVLSNSTLKNNSTVSAFSDGGGIFNTGTGSLEITNSTLDHNSAKDEGGGLVNNGSVTVNNSTFTGNSAADGGGISNDGIITISNTTISGNSASGKSTLAVSSDSNVNNGGGIYNRGTLTLVSSTLTINSATNGGGIFNSLGSPYSYPDIANVQNTIIASNLLNENGINPDVSGIFTSNGDNLIGDRTGSSGFDALGDVVGTSDNPITQDLLP